MSLTLTPPPPLQALAAGYVMEGVCGTPPSMPSGMEAMPDYLLTPGVQEILGGGGDDGMGAGMGSLPTPEMPPAAGAGAGAAAARGWRPAAPQFEDADATVALLPAAQLAQAGYPMEATMVLFPRGGDGAAAAAPAEAAAPKAVAAAPAPAAKAPVEKAAAAPAAPKPAVEAPAAAAAEPVKPKPAPEVAAPKPAAPVPAAPAAPEPQQQQQQAKQQPAAPAAAAPAAAPKPASPPAAAAKALAASPALSEDPDLPSTGRQAAPPASRGVRESIPLFVMNPGSLVASAPAGEEEDVDDFLARAEGEPPADGKPAGGGRRSSAGSRMLGAAPQRVNGASASAAANVSRLETVAEAPMSLPNSEEPE
jgi:hypothetical protein